jgi:hypothetical protein
MLLRQRSDSLISSIAMQNPVATAAFKLKEPPYPLDALEPHMSEVCVVNT